MVGGLNILFVDLCMENLFVMNCYLDDNQLLCLVKKGSLYIDCGGCWGVYLLCLIL